VITLTGSAQKGHLLAEIAATFTHHDLKLQGQIFVPAELPVQFLRHHPDRRFTIHQPVNSSVING
jgi:hypothetical protein